ncbi:MAG TPA: hypothetical protein VKV40_00295 [Ktedonobacteraceae bacterium]|nr:hypothetical protein [Ktedonobacteraceae bacterium]
MQQAQSWREVPGRLIQTPAERQDPAALPDVHPQTLYRWARGSSPRLATLQRLLLFLSEPESAAFRALLEAEFGSNLDEARSEGDSDAHEILVTHLTRFPRTLALVCPTRRSGSVSSRFSSNYPWPGCARLST